MVMSACGSHVLKVQHVSVLLPNSAKIYVEYSCWWIPQLLVHQVREVSLKTLLPNCILSFWSNKVSHGPNNRLKGWMASIKGHFFILSMTIFQCIYFVGSDIFARHFCWISALISLHLSIVQVCCLTLWSFTCQQRSIKISSSSVL